MGNQESKTESLRDDLLIKMQVMRNTINMLQTIGFNPSKMPRDDDEKLIYSSILDQYICEDLKTGPKNCQHVDLVMVTNEGLVGYTKKLKQIEDMLIRAENEKRKDWLEGQVVVFNNLTTNFVGWLNEMKASLVGYQQSGMTKAGWISNRYPKFTDQNIKELIVAMDQGIEALSSYSDDYLNCQKIIQEDEKWEQKQEKASKKQSLNQLWDTKCNVDPEWVDSLFCKMGDGNEIASLVMRMRFTVPLNPNKHVLKALYSAGLPQGVLDGYLKKIDCGRPFRWADLANIVKIVNNFIGLVEPSMNNVGLTVKQPRRPHNQQRTIDLDQIFDTKCSTTSDWKGTLFCEMGYNNAAATLIGKMKFAVPCSGSLLKKKCVNPNDNIILKLIDTIINASSGTGTSGSVMQTITGAGLSKAFTAITTKIRTNQLLDWDDLRNLYRITQLPGINYGLQKALGMPIFEFINQSVQPIGLGFGL